MEQPAEQIIADADEELEELEEDEIVKEFPGSVGGPVAFASASKAAGRYC